MQLKKYMFLVVVFIKKYARKNHRVPIPVNSVKLVGMETLRN
ncbi:hypothetical protein M918_09845 [Clostridium sp. BL8]|nr:hypothetical protein M918_09845 [Clostridium sp. BL8]